MEDVELLSIQIGKTKQYQQEKQDGKIFKAYTTSFKKNLVSGPVEITKNGLKGDEVADSKHHGGVDKAIFANSFSNYARWAKNLEVENLSFGALGENFTIEGLSEKSVNIGDIHAFGDVVLQVSQPRKPCYKISHFWRNLNFTKSIYESGLTGWYYRVLTPGFIKAPCRVIVEKTDKFRISILDANRSFRNPRADQDIYNNLSKHPFLADAWKKDIIKRYELKDSSFPVYMETP